MSHIGVTPSWRACTWSNTCTSTGPFTPFIQVCFWHLFDTTCGKLFGFVLNVTLFTSSLFTYAKVEASEASATARGSRSQPTLTSLVWHPVLSRFCPRVQPSNKNTQQPITRNLHPLPCELTLSCIFLFLETALAGVFIRPLALSIANDTLANTILCYNKDWNPTFTYLLFCIFYLQKQYISQGNQ